MEIIEKFKIRRVFQLVFATIGIYISLRYTKECSAGIENGIMFCIEVLVPSLFIFMVLSAYIIKSSIAEMIFARCERLSKALFGLPSGSLAVIALSVIGGYPIGARCTALMYEKGSLNEKQAEKTAYIAVCAGPGFLISFVGQSMLGSQKAGYILLVAEVVSLLLGGIIIGRTVKCNTGNTKATKLSEEKGLLISSVTDASKSAFNMSATVVLCSALTEVIATLVLSEQLSDIIAATLEVTNGCMRLCGNYPIEMVAFFIGFGGISVHLQVYAGLGKVKINKGLFFLFRIIQGIISMATAYILLLIFPIEINVFNSISTELTAGKSATLIGSSALLISSMCFVGATQKDSIRR